MFRRFRFSLLLVALVGSSAWARDVLFVPQPNLVASPALLSSSLTIGSTGATFTGQTGKAQAGGSFVDLRYAFALRNSEEPRDAGWALGVAVGSVREAITGDILIPGSWYAELGLGRGTTTAQTGRLSGLRGYAELLVRDQRNLRSLGFEQKMVDVGLPYERRNAALAFRIGVASDPSGEGLVHQAAPPFYYQTQIGIYLPVSNVNGDNQRVYMNVQANAGIVCGVEGLSCGFGVNFLNSKRSQGAFESVQELSRHITLGPSVRMNWSNHYSLGLTAHWSWMKGAGLWNEKHHKNRDNKWQAGWDSIPTEVKDGLPVLQLVFSGNI